MDEKVNELKWEITIPLLSNKVLINQTILVFLITYLIISFIFSLIFLPQGAYKELLSLLLIFFLVCLGLFILSLLVMLIVFGNRMNLRFTINKKGVLYEMIDKRAKRLNTLGIILGALTNKPQVTGSSLIAKSRESLLIKYRDIKKIEVKDKEKVILLKNKWRTILAIFCKDDNYEEVKEYLREKI